MWVTAVVLFVFYSHYSLMSLEFTPIFYSSSVHYGEYSRNQCLRRRSVTACVGPITREEGRDKSQDFIMNMLWSYCVCCAIEYITLRWTSCRLPNEFPRCGIMKKNKTIQMFPRAHKAHQLHEAVSSSSPTCFNKRHLFLFHGYFLFHQKGQLRLSCDLRWRLRITATRRKQSDSTQIKRLPGWNVYSCFLLQGELCSVRGLVTL